MKTLTIDIQDSFLKEFLNFVQKNQNKILVRNSSDYEDIYFDDRKKQLQKIKLNPKQPPANLPTLKKKPLNFIKKVDQVKSKSFQQKTATLKKLFRWLTRPE